MIVIIAQDTTIYKVTNKVKIFLIALGIMVYVNQELKIKT
jgi:hypothetical protein